MQFTDQEKNKIQYLAEKMKESKNILLYYKIASQIGINLLEKAIGLTLEDSKIENPGAYMTAICKSYGFKPNTEKFLN